jgi:hypothetical protein
MITRHEAHLDRTNIWAQLAAQLPAGVISWRQDGKSVMRDGRWFARFVAYIDANTVRERLDSVVPGEWDLTLELLPSLVSDDAEGANCSFKARLQILGVIREDVGTGRDYKSAATDAFKRAAVRFGIAHELYDYEQNWVQVDGDSRYAKPLEDPQAAYTRRFGTPNGAATSKRRGERSAARQDSRQEQTDRVADVVTVNDAVAPTDDAFVRNAASADSPSCPKCGGKTWDNRLSKRNPKAPDYKCRDRSCDGVIWPPKVANGGAPAADAPVAQASPAVAPTEAADASESGSLALVDDLPF